MLKRYFQTPERLPLTGEQQAVVDTAFTGADMTVKAYAGSGKTSLLDELGISLAKPGYYIVFNAANQRAARARLPSFINAVTGHALAFRRTVELSDDLQRKFAAANNGASLPLSAIQQITRNYPRPEIGTPQQITSAVAQAINGFMASADPAITDSHIPRSAYPLELRGKLQSSQAREFAEAIAVMGNAVWFQICNPNNDCPLTHDAYLKMFQLSQPDLENEHGIWLCDEFQDTNPVLVDIIDRQAGQKIYVGDPYQQIYSWRGAVNALDRTGVKVQRLSESFRFGSELAGLATILLRSLGESVPMKGRGKPLAQFNLDGGHTLLVRNNLTMFEAAAAYHRQKRPVSLSKVPMSALGQLQSAYALYTGQMSNVRGAHLRAMGNWNQFREVTEASGDEHSLKLIKLVEKQRDSLDLISEIIAINKHRSYDPRAVHICTTHRAKGLQWDNVRLSNDLAPDEDTMNLLASGRYDKLSTIQREAVNLLYVACTRARKSIHLNPVIKRVFSLLNTL